MTARTPSWMYIRVSTADRGQTVENQLRPLQEAAGRLDWHGIRVNAIGPDSKGGGARRMVGTSARPSRIESILIAKVAIRERLVATSSRGPTLARGYRL